MKVGVLGSGDVAKVLAGGFLKHGHLVVMGTRDPAKLEDWAAENPAGRVGGFADAAASAELVVSCFQAAEISRRHFARAAEIEEMKGFDFIGAKSPW